MLKSCLFFADNEIKLCKSGLSDTGWKLVDTKNQYFLSFLLRHKLPLLSVVFKQICLSESGKLYGGSTQFSMVRIFFLLYPLLGMQIKSTTKSSPKYSWEHVFCLKHQTKNFYLSKPSKSSLNIQNDTNTYCFMFFFSFVLRLASRGVVWPTFYSHILELRGFGCIMLLLFPSFPVPYPTSFPLLFPRRCPSHLPSAESHGNEVVSHLSLFLFSSSPPWHFSH